MKPYEIKMEIAGKTAMWTRPDTGDCPVSYPAPTYSAVKGIFESVLWGPAVEIRPFKVEICNPLRFQGHATNYNGPLRKSGTEGAYQFFSTVLTDVSPAGRDAGKPGCRGALTSDGNASTQDILNHFISTPAWVRNRLT